ncbi:hydantoinase/oxoprolinase family protein [candidate division KSB1 bacterium]|nr:hydantoinase/oxoprolinase family protein [candidate division KSB1 bacterium]
MQTKSNKTPWQIWIDTGGTFTDCLAKDPQGNLHRAKVLSTSALRGMVVEQIEPDQFRIKEKWGVPANFVQGFRFSLLDKTHDEVLVAKYDAEKSILVLNKPLNFDISANSAFEVCSTEEAPILAARMVTKTLPQKPLPNINMRLATTRGTNALLERKGVPTALFITRGFGDLLRIGTQQRPDIFALEIIKPEPLYEVVVEVDERLNSDGSVLRPLKLNSLQAEVEALVRKGIRVAAVALMHSYQNPRHEQELADFLEQRGFEHVSRSAELAPFIKIVPRAETAVVDAYLSPVIKDYLNKVNASLNNGRLHVMTSAGGLVSSADFHAKDSLLSGPAGGVVGAALSGKRSGYEKVIVFDMGGTSTDVARFDGDFEYAFEHEVGDAHLVGTALAIESVAAGGGSICKFDGYRLRVGPESAGAHPGPACYGTGGPLTLTDVNLLLGRLDPTRFEIPISKEQAESQFSSLQKEIQSQTAESPEKEALLQGFLDIANERMADAIRRVSVRKGLDPRDYALVAFGGAGGQHACGIATRLEIETIIIPQDASLLSAYGLGNAVLERFSEKQILKKLKEIEGEIPDLINKLSSEAFKTVAAEGVPDAQIEVRRRFVNMRFIGQDSILTVEYDGEMALEKAFEEKYHEIYGHLPGDRDIEIESVRVICSTIAASEEAPESLPPKKTKPSRFSKPGRFLGYEGSVHSYFDGEWRELPFFERSKLKPGAYFAGPALVFEQHSATVIESGWQARVDGAGALLLKYMNECNAS